MSIPAWQIGLISGLGSLALLVGAVVSYRACKSRSPPVPAPEDDVEEASKTPAAKPSKPPAAKPSKPPVADETQSEEAISESVLPSGKRPSSTATRPPVYPGDRTLLRNWMRDRMKVPFETRLNAMRTKVADLTM